MTTRTRFSKTVPSLDARQLRWLRPGVFDARHLNPPSGSDCTHLLIRQDGSLGWCDSDGEQSADEQGRVSRFTVRQLIRVES